MKSKKNKRKKLTSDIIQGKKFKSNSNEINKDCSTYNRNQRSVSTQFPVSESEIQSDEKENDVKKCYKAKQKSTEMEENLLCSICQEIMYNCVSIQPCLHSYCAHCLLKWRKSGECCPSCRGLISSVSINSLVRNIIDAYLAQHPEKIQPIDEREEADLEVAKNMNILFSVPQNAKSFFGPSTSTRVFSSSASSSSSSASVSSNLFSDYSSYTSISSSSTSVSTSSTSVSSSPFNVSIRASSRSISVSSSSTSVSSSPLNVSIRVSSRSISVSSSSTSVSSSSTSVSSSPTRVFTRSTSFSSSTSSSPSISPKSANY